MTPIVGREQELARIDRFVVEAQTRYLGLVLEGHAGIGKTTVWREAVRRAEMAGFRVLSCRPAQAETALAYAALADLLGSVDEDAFVDLPEPQRDALAVALLRSGPSRARIDPRTVATALRSVLVRAAETAPLAIAIDDVQWLDDASTAALSFALRRLDPAVGTAFLGTVRTDPGSCGHGVDLEHMRPDRIERVRLGPLNLSALYHVLREQLGLVVPRPTLKAIEQASAGNALFALEIGRLLLEHGVPRVGEPLPVPPDIGTLLQRRLRIMRPATRQVLLAAALLADPRVDTVRRALGRSVESDLAPAEGEHVVRLEGDAIVFAHPLFATAIVSASTTAARRRTHLCLADAVDELEPRARHLALGTDGCSEAAATVATEAARRAFWRGAPLAAAELAELALRLAEPDSPELPRRTLDLAEYLFAAGDIAAAREALETSSWRTWPQGDQARALSRLGDVIASSEPTDVVVERLESLLSATTLDQSRAVLHSALSFTTAAFDVPTAVRHADIALELLGGIGDDPDPELLAEALYMQLRARVLGGHGLDRRLIRRIQRLEARLPADRSSRHPVSRHVAYWPKYVDDLESSRAWLERNLSDSSTTGDETVQHAAHLHLAVTECWAGELHTARRHALAAVGIAQGPLESAALALVEAHLGNADAVRTLCARHLERCSSHRVEVSFRGALGLLELSLADHEAAWTNLDAGLAMLDGTGCVEPGIYRIHADAAEAAVARGDDSRAEKIASFLAEHGELTAHRWSLATCARVRALVAAARGDLHDALAEVELALTRHENLPMPFERARTLLVAGVIQRRLRQRGRAKTSFEEACGMFDRMGARLWSERARAELGRVGLRRSSGDELTESERRVAELAARGLTRREVASALHISPKTVDATLTRVYRKIGVRSRAELGARMVELVQK